MWAVCRSAMLLLFSCLVQPLYALNRRQGMRFGSTA
jgi:hypothetical protein